MDLAFWNNIDFFLKKFEFHISENLITSNFSFT